jgi:hypothetical protein
VWGGGGCCRAIAPQIEIKKRIVFAKKMISKVLRDLPISRNQSQKSVDDRYIGIMEKKENNLRCIRINYKNQNYVL